ncbi:MAG: sigma-70 family RNA polymerase sigma factor [Planctomycetes bacterium]|nr:sigma-70 family RNA polymerase sigma factor [Planctomycetota bacterium]
MRSSADQQAWNRFVELYTPLLFHWTRLLGLQAQDAADLVQDVFLVLIRKLPEFQYDRDKSFRGWLRTVLLNKWRKDRRNPSPPPLAAASPAWSDLVSPDNTIAFGEDEYRHYLVGQALRLMQAEFQPSTWKACWEYVVRGRPAAEVAAELGLQVGTVYAAKCRVLSRLRQELAGLLD